jgi:hypothetical protein
VSIDLLAQESSLTVERDLWWNCPEPTDFGHGIQASYEGSNPAIDLVVLPSLLANRLEIIPLSRFRECKDHGQFTSRVYVPR